MKQQADSNSSDFVRTQGRALVVGDADRPLRLLGVNFPVYGWGDPDLTSADILAMPNFQSADYHRVAELGLNCIRLNVSAVLFADNDGEFSERSAGWEWLDQQITAARAACVYLILDMHAPPGGYQAPGYTGTFWETDTTQRDQLKVLWSAIAQHCRHEPQIAAYSLINEPCTHQRLDLWTAYAQALVDAIRAVDPLHLIIIEQDIEIGAPFLLNGANLMYEFHFYEPWRYAAQFWRYGFQGRFGDPATPTLPWTWQEREPVGASFHVTDPRVIGALPLVRRLETLDEFTVMEHAADGSASVLMRVKLNRDETLRSVSDDVPDDPFPVSPAQWQPFDAAQHKCEVLAFPVRQGMTYTISGGLGLELLPLALNKDDEFAPFTPETIEARLLGEHGLQFYLDHNVPVNIGEFGLSPHAFKADRGGKAWLKTVLTLFAKYQVNWQYWVYSGAADFALYNNHDEYPAAHHANQTALGILRAYSHSPMTKECP